MVRIFLSILIDGGVGKALEGGSVLNILDRLREFFQPQQRSKDDEKWSGRRDSNSRPPGPKPGALARLRYAPTVKFFLKGKFKKGNCDIRVSFIFFEARNKQTTAPKVNHENHQ